MRFATRCRNEKQFSSLYKSRTCARIRAEQKQLENIFVLLCTSSGFVNKRPRHRSENVCF
jgi:hypothetical protein